MYQLDGRDLIFGWLERETDTRRRQAMLDWLARFAERPRTDAQRVPGLRAPVYVTVVPLDPPVVVRFLIAEEFRTIRLIELLPLP